MKKSILSYLAAALFAACGSPEAHNHTAGADHHSADDLEPLAYTVYTDSAELFVEFKPLIVGQESRFAAHFTRTGALYTAITKGTASVALHGIGAPMGDGRNAPSSPASSAWRSRLRRRAVAHLTFILDAVGRADTLEVDGLTVYPDAARPRGERPPDPPGDITYLKEQAWKIPFALERVEKSPFAASVRVGAEVEPAIAGEQVITARSAGVVHLLGDAPLEGMTVTKGQSLFSLSRQGVIAGAGAAVQQAQRLRARQGRPWSAPSRP
ncbi:MAG: hypothetical protein IPK99_07410 [Flavobacteriales bacterium]|nr:hypothetical protein [Flavobacteriales bacterium]